jgi:hypothetical protein
MAHKVMEGNVVHLKVWNGPLEGLEEAHFGEVILRTGSAQLALSLYTWTRYGWPTTYGAFSAGAWISMIQNALTHAQRLRITYEDTNNTVLQVTLLPAA